MSLEIFQVDAFAERPFEGNPAAVVPLAGSVDETWAARVALEMNLSETAFLWPEGDHFRLRWWTPAREVRLCGHATLASAHVLWETGRLAAGETAAFETLSGRLSCGRRGDGAIEMDFPARPPEPAASPEGLAEALGAEALEVQRSAEDLLVVLASEKAVRELSVDMSALAKLPVRGTIVTARGEPATAADFVSRFFAPRFGVPEDPVTGSAHCVLAPYWAERLGRAELTGYQASPRGGRVEVQVKGDRVVLAGRAITVLRGALCEAAEPS